VNLEPYGLYYSLLVGVLMRTKMLQFRKICQGSRSFLGSSEHLGYIPNLAPGVHVPEPMHLRPPLPPHCAAVVSGWLARMRFQLDSVPADSKATTELEGAIALYWLCLLGLSIGFCLLASLYWFCLLALSVGSHYWFSLLALSVVSLSAGWGQFLLGAANHLCIHHYVCSHPCIIAGRCNRCLGEPECRWGQVTPHHTVVITVFITVLITTLITAPITVFIHVFIAAPLTVLKTVLITVLITVLR
jgi:hypothetical protein